MAVFRTQRRVEFADTDMEGMVHFARYLVYLETAEHELLRSAGHEVNGVHDGVRHTWPRVKVECEYLAPLHFGDRVEIEVEVERRGRSSVTYRHTMRLDETPVARARITTVHCRRADDGALTPAPIPDDLASALDTLRPEDRSPDEP